MNSAKAVLLQTLQPPDLGAVDAALERLAVLGALGSASDTGEVTPLGRLLSAFPSDLTLARLVAFGAVLGVLPDAIVCASAASVGEVFFMPHSLAASDPVDYASGVTKVARARWLFGRDPAIACAAAAAAALQPLQLPPPLQWPLGWASWGAAPPGPAPRPQSLAPAPGQKREGHGQEGHRTRALPAPPPPWQRWQHCQRH